MTTSAVAQPSIEEKLHLSARAGHFLDRWLKIQVELFTPNMPKDRRERTINILNRLARRHDSLTPYPYKLGTHGGAR